MMQDGEILGLAGAFQAARLVQELAHEGRCGEAAFARSIESVFQLDADSAEAVFGGNAGVRHGLEALVAQLEGGKRDPAITRIVASVVHLERKLNSRSKTRAELREGILAARRGAESMGPTHEGVVARLADIYLTSISCLRPRVLVQGSGLYLTQPRTVARIRALLLAAVRAVVLWRQMGGSRWRLIAHRHKLAKTAKEMLAEM